MRTVTPHPAALVDLSGNGIAVVCLGLPDYSLCALFRTSFAFLVEKHGVLHLKLEFPFKLVLTILEMVKKRSLELVVVSRTHVFLVLWALGSRVVYA